MAARNSVAAVELPRGLLLDLDDTILSFSASADPCWREVCARFAPSVPGVAEDELFRAIRAAARSFWADPELDDRGRRDLVWSRRQIVGAAVGSVAADSEGIASEIADAYSELRERRVTLFPGALSALRELRRRGVGLALVTNGSSRAQRAKIERFALEPLLDSILVEEEVGCGKPDPRIFRAALEALDVSAPDAWMIGDNLERDVAGAQSLGIHGIWCDHGARGLPAESPVRPDRIVTGLAHLLADLA